MTRTDPLFIQSLAKGLALLEAFANRPSVMSMNELMEQSGLDRSTTQRMAHTLVALGYMERGPGGKGFTPGKKILERTFDYLRSVPLLERATPLIVELQLESSERVELSLFNDLTIIFALRRQTKRHIFNATLVGRPLPTVQTAGGRAIMSHLSDEEVDDIIERSAVMPLGTMPVTPKTTHDPALIREFVRDARANGFAVASEESLLGEINLASAVLDRDGRPIAAIHIAASLSDWTLEDFSKRFSSLIVNAARALSGKNGMS